MSPLLQAALTAIVRALLVGAAGWLVSHNVWTQGDATTYLEAAALAIVGLGWSLWEKYKSRLSYLAAKQAPTGASDAHVELIAASPAIKAQAFDAAVK